MTDPDLSDEDRAFMTMPKYGRGKGPTPRERELEALLRERELEALLRESGECLADLSNYTFVASFEDQRDIAGLQAKIDKALDDSPDA